jgi:hypothetical protein
VRGEKQSEKGTQRFEEKKTMTNGNEEKKRKPTPKEN